MRLKILCRSEIVGLMADTQRKYGLIWPARIHPLQIEMACIRKGIGLSLAHHYEQMRRFLWPHLDGDQEGQRWHTLCRDEILANKVTVLMGPGSSGKTHEAAVAFLSEYMVFPEETCVLVSSTDLRGLELRVWGEIKALFQMAKDRFAFLPGNLIDSKHCIATDEIDEDTSRDLRKGIIGIPCVQNGKFVGLGKYAGIKQKRMRLIADEAQFMGASFLSAFANLDKNVDFKAVILGNPNDPMDPLGKAAEPKEGWSRYMDVNKTTVWPTRFMDGRCVNLIGTDSPNFDFPPDKPPRFPYLISRKKIENTLSFFSKDSLEFRSQCIGNMRVATMERRVITRDMCEQFRATQPVIWRGTPTTKIASLDSAYGGDRCVGGHIEFGENVDGAQILAITPPLLVPVQVGEGMTPEDSIAKWVREYCERNSIPPQNFFHDSTGRGSLGTAIAREWSAQCNPVEFGGEPTARPVSLDLYIIDPTTKARRLKTCKEHYRKFVTELWFSVRYAIEAGQVRGLPEEVMEEGCMREWNLTNNSKRELETKLEMKERSGRSPDLFDWLAIAVEGARRRGFQIRKLANTASTAKTEEWLIDLNRKATHRDHSMDLNYDAG